ncbi:ABC transporter permease [Mesorhizobium sp. M1A.F.Ca.ET.072.01.1.1]|uniref:ABC transporter permease n=1 Tax=Mesorhizobium sp. M1A.F.Ca.ET.072.01.1.1 TaxID=2496753 RepID=UPI000FD18E89|nr:ABC transporter permease [Mesorhizobium sp. M1A.F.Ca.ET.072.01.1.1]RUW51107.1 ABC transporter permease [Mesorhizobium sp. M1A.F.Ca.ET.072.01.1.1]TIV03090.1 MAG: ABC transporter permease subunit [Mesorhizobium sp.]
MTITADQLTVTSDSKLLLLELQRLRRWQKLKALIPLTPLLLFILAFFFVPVSRMLFHAVHDDTLSALMPRTTAELTRWNGENLPDEAAFAALASDLNEAWSRKTAGAIAKRLNYELPGSNQQVMSSARKAVTLPSGPYRDAMLNISRLWSKREVWILLKRGVSNYTPYYLLRSVDLQRDPDGRIVTMPPDQAIFRDVFLRTFTISAGVMFLTLLLGFPLAYLLATLPKRITNILMILVILPFWTSVLVRTSAWIVLLQQQGLVNDVLLALHIVSRPIELVFNRVGTIVAMTHIQLPITLLPIYSIMKTISPNHIRAARSLGAGPFVAFWTVYFPQTFPGIAAGCLLTFIMCLGYYITPALVGGPADQMVSTFIAHYTNEDLNWGMASALGAILLLATLLLYHFYNKLAGPDQLNTR